MASYAVAWRKDGEDVRVGKLELAGKGIRLEAGERQGGRVSVLRVLYRDVSDAVMAGFNERIGGRPTVTLTSVRGLVSISPVGFGMARDVLEHVHSALSERSE